MNNATFRNHQLLYAQTLDFRNIYISLILSFSQKCRVTQVGKLLHHLEEGAIWWIYTDSLLCSQALGRRAVGHVMPSSCTSPSTALRISDEDSSQSNVNPSGWTESHWELILQVQREDDLSWLEIWLARGQHLVSQHWSLFPTYSHFWKIHIWKLISFGLSNMKVGLWSGTKHSELWPKRNVLIKTRNNRSKGLKLTANSMFLKTTLWVC